MQGNLVTLLTSLHTVLAPFAFESRHMRYMGIQINGNSIFTWKDYTEQQETDQLQYIPRYMHTVFALLCFVVVIHWLIFPYPSGLLHWHCGNLTIAQVPARQPWWIWIHTSCEFIMNDCITTTKQSTTKPCAYFLGYIVGSELLAHYEDNPALTHSITMTS